VANSIQDSVLVPGANPDPASPDHAPVKSAIQARGGIVFGRMRWALAISVMAAAIVLLAVWALGVHHH
jgi:hypothetical protein